MHTQSFHAHKFPNTIPYPWIPQDPILTEYRIQGLPSLRFHINLHPLIDFVLNIHSRQSFTFYPVYISWSTHLQGRIALGYPRCLCRLYLQSKSTNQTINLNLSNKKYLIGCGFSVHLSGYRGPNGGRGYRRSRKRSLTFRITRLSVIHQGHGNRLMMFFSVHEWKKLLK